ncbi:phosphoribosyltransferase domain-containing protein [Lachnobacterium bovis]|uniref:TRSP domain C terminus to PRTase_2 n=1 Tax=Lachnobacterium bovis TaxID=140626 RepID=A0A1H9RRU8_9FIRM|nr:phosphoribosyltransferase domain-containing protein [Lachnobacterium bovis]SER75175.1 TRSP domain C terminus to PRTase_2 [Lachnobacterium bovis]
MNNQNYKQDDLVVIAKRQNNQKRTYLVVNKLQGKHIPVKPKNALDMFDSLAQILKEKYKNEKVLFVGFAETATAIGARVAITFGGTYIQTTREKIPGVEYLFFTESHSHATEQKLVENDIRKWITKVDRIIFVEDEVTTGNTIKKIIDIIKNKYQEEVKFAVASILNGMDELAIQKYQEAKIDLNYLVKTNHKEFEQVVLDIVEDGEYIVSSDEIKKDVLAEIVEIEGLIDTRRAVDSKEYQEACRKLAENIFEIINYNSNKNNNNILVLGTEECMYPAIFTGAFLQEKGIEVRTHSTTRSPIAVSKKEGYPFEKRYQLSSFYDEDRITFIYNLKKYDKVVIVTDAKNLEKNKGLTTLVSSLKSNGNDHILCVNWIKK